MSNRLTERLNQVLPKVTSKEFLSSQGIGNEIACYIFDYPAEEELMIRERVQGMVDRITSHYNKLNFLHLDLFEVMLEYLESRKLLDKVRQMESRKNDAGIISALQGPMAAEKVTAYIEKNYNPAERDLIFVSGVGTVWPILRAHSFLNCMHSALQGTPLVLFYPGNFDGMTLNLFGRIKSPGSKSVGSDSYYRAFSLIPK